MSCLPLSYRLNWFLLWLLIQAGTSTAQVKELAHLSPNGRIVRLWMYARDGLSDTTTRRRRVDSTMTIARELNDDQLYWYALLHRAWYDADRQIDHKKPVTAYAKAGPQFEACPLEVVRGSYYFLYGQYLFYNKLEFNKAFRLLFRARSIFEKIGYEHIPEAIFYLSWLGYDYYWFEDYKSAIRYLTLTPRFRCDSIVPLYYSQHTFGMAYLQRKEYERAKPLFQNVMALAKASNNPAWVGIASNSYGHVLQLQGRNREALPYLYQDVALNAKEVPESAALSCLFIAKSLLALDSTAKANTYILRARHLYNGHVFSPYFVNYFETLTAYHRKVGNYAKATVYFDSVLALNDSLKTIFSDKALLLAENSMNADRYLSNIQQIEAEKRHAILIRNLLITALCLFGLLGIYALNQNRQKLKKERQIQEEQRKRADEQLAHTKAQLDQYVANFQQKNELVSRISDELAPEQQDSPELMVRQQQQLRTLRQRVILTDNDWQQFRQLFEQIYPFFFENLRQQHPELTPAEIRLLALLKLNVPAKDMAYMLGISMGSIRTSRYRLRKKFNLSGQSSMAELFTDLSDEMGKEPLDSLEG